MKALNAKHKKEITGGLIIEVDLSQDDPIAAYKLAQLTVQVHTVTIVCYFK